MCDFCDENKKDFRVNAIKELDGSGLRACATCTQELWRLGVVDFRKGLGFFEVKPTAEAVSVN